VELNLLFSIMVRTKMALLLFSVGEKKDKVKTPV